MCCGALFTRCRCLSKADRKSTRLNSSHGYISYAVFCLKKKTSLHTGKRRAPTGETARSAANVRRPKGSPAQHSRPPESTELHHLLQRPPLARKPFTDTL